MSDSVVKSGNLPLITREEDFEDFSPSLAARFIRNELYPLICKRDRLPRFEAGYAKWADGLIEKARLRKLEEAEKLRIQKDARNTRDRENRKRAREARGDDCATKRAKMDEIEELQRQLDTMRAKTTEMARETEFKAYLAAKSAGRREGITTPPVGSAMQAIKANAMAMSESDSDNASDNASDSDGDNASDNDGDNASDSDGSSAEGEVDVLAAAQVHAVESSSQQANAMSNSFGTDSDSDPDSDSDIESEVEDTDSD